MPIDNDTYARAPRFALEAHGAQKRKGSPVPYITHPVAVSAMLAQYEYPQDLVTAGLLHDTIEDAGVSFHTVAELFGLPADEFGFFGPVGSKPGRIVAAGTCVEPQSMIEAMASGRAAALGLAGAVR